MKTEIELQDLENLREHLRSSLESNKELQEKLDSLDEADLKKRAVDLSWRLFHSYLGCMFKSLGFVTRGETPIICHANLERELGKKWYDSDRITFDIGATVTTKFRQAFLNIGIVPKDEMNDGDDHSL
jgi:hypothetical protein